MLPNSTKSPLPATCSRAIWRQSFLFVRCQAEFRHEAHRNSAAGHPSPNKLVVGAENYDRLFLGAVFGEVDEKILYVFAATESLAAEIEEKFALHLSIVASQIAGTPVDFVVALPD
jgi:hypothetical protein